MNMVEHLVGFALITTLTTFVVNIGIALYGIFAKRSLIKKIMALIIFSDSINILAVAFGYRSLVRASPSPPILPSIPSSPNDIEAFAGTSVDPLPQAFVITAVVIGLSVIVLLISLAVRYYEHYNTMDLVTHSEESEDGEIA